MAVKTLAQRGGGHPIPEGSAGACAEGHLVGSRDADVDVAHAGHMVAGDQNDTFSAAVLTFLAGLRSGTTEP